MTTVPRDTPKRNNTRTYSLWEWTRAYLVLALWLPLFPVMWLLDGRTLPGWLQWKLFRHHVRYTVEHPMDFRIPPDEAVGVYMERWWRVPRNWASNIYFHIVRRSDDDRALHDHPWFSFSIVLDGGYHEHTIDAGGVHHKKWFGPGTMRFRPSGKYAHRLELETLTPETDGVSFRELPARTIFITGPVLRRWGFHDTRQWVDAYDWDAFCEKHNLKAMRMDGGSDAVTSSRNNHRSN